MAEDVDHLQTEIAAVVALVGDPATPERPGARWTPSPTLQPWLEVNSA